jgi:hypothetical protein
VVGYLAGDEILLFFAAERRHKMIKRENIRKNGW